MEGLKILSEEMVRNFGGDTLFPILIIVGIFFLTFGICSFIYCGVEIEDSLLFVFGVLLLIVSIVGSVGNTCYKKYIKVTPIEDKYFIDVTKYKIVKVEGEIIYLEDNNKYNKEGEIIE